MRQGRILAAPNGSIIMGEDSPANALTVEQELEKYGVVRAAVKPEFTSDEKLFGKIQAKRVQESLRKPRLFDAKLRTIGVDKEALDAQVEERRQREALEARHDKAYDGLCISVDKQLKLLELEKRRIKTDMERDAKEFSLENLSFKQRREFDLNDKDALKKEMPCRIGDDDPRCTIASMQQFEGEDLSKRERQIRQMEQQADWIEQQVFEKRMSGTGRKQDERQFAEQVESITTLRNEIEEREDILRKNLSTAQQVFNSQQALVLEGVKKAGAAVDNVLNQKEMEHWEQDPWLNETIAYHNESNGRVRRAEFKGADRDDRVECQAFQLVQMDEKTVRTGGTRTEDRVFAHQSEATRRQLIIMEREKQRSQRAAAQATRDENRKLAQQQAEHQKYLKDSVYRNHCSPEYFAQFGTSAR